MKTIIKQVEIEALLTVEDLMRIFRYESSETIHDKWKAGELPAPSVGRGRSARWEPQVVQDWIKQGKGL